MIRRVLLFAVFLLLLAWLWLVGSVASFAWSLFARIAGGS